MIDVTCAIIRNEEEEILVVQKGESTDHPFKWEFPGGKLQSGETEEECIIREIREELAMDIVLVERLPEVEYDYGFRKVRLIPFICDTLDEFPFLAEHIAFKWIGPEELEGVDFSGADIPIARQYLDKTLTARGKDHQDEDIRSRNLSDDKELRALVDRMMSMKEAEGIAVSAIDKPAVFNKLLEFSFSGEEKLAFRASWALTKACDLAPEIIYPHLNSIIDRLQDLENESVLRSFLRIISFTDPEKIGGKQHGLMADKCFSLLRSGFSAIAVKAYSMEILYKLALKYPELTNELAATILLLQTGGSAGIVARGRLILKKLAKTSM